MAAGCCGFSGTVRDPAQDMPDSAIPVQAAFSPRFTYFLAETRPSEDSLVGTFMTHVYGHLSIFIQGIIMVTNIE